MVYQAGCHKTKMNVLHKALSDAYRKNFYGANHKIRIGGFGEMSLQKHEISRHIHQTLAVLVQQITLIHCLSKLTMLLFCPSVGEIQ